MSFHAFVTGLAGGYSKIKEEKRNLLGQKELAQIELEKASLKNPTNSRTYGSMTYIPTDIDNLPNEDRKLFQGLADYANMFDRNDQQAFDKLSEGDRSELTTNIKGAWDAFTDLVSPGTGGSGENIKEYYRMFPNLDAFKKMPELHKYLTETDPTNSILGKVVYDSNHEILGINNNEQGTPSIFEPEIENSAVKLQQEGNLTSIPSSLITTPKKWGGTYDFGGVEQEKKFYSDVQEILTSRQFGGMEGIQAQKLIDDPDRQWAAFAVYAAYGLDTDQLSKDDFAKEMVELQQIYGVSDTQLFTVAAKGMMKYEMEPGASKSRMSVTRKWKDLTTKQKQAVDNSLSQSNEIVEDVRKLAKLWEDAKYKPGIIGTLESFARGVLTDDHSILKTIGLVSRDMKQHTNFLGINEAVAGGVQMNARTFTSDANEKGSLAWHIAGIEKSVQRGNENGKYYDYEKDKWIYENAQGQAEGYRARKALEVSLAYRLTVLEQGSGGNTISDKDFKVSLQKLRGTPLASREQIVDGLREILRTASRGAIKAELLAENPKAGRHLVTMYERFRDEKQFYWEEMERKLSPYFDTKKHGQNLHPDGRPDTLNEVFANRLNYLKNNLNFSLGINKGNKRLYADLSNGELASVLGEEGFKIAADKNLGRNTTSGTNVTYDWENQDNVVVGSGEVAGGGGSTPTAGPIAKEGFVKLPTKVEKRPDRLKRYTAPLRDEAEMQELLEKDQKKWDLQYNQYYNVDGNLKDGMQEVSFESLRPLMENKKSKIVELIKTRKLPRPDDLPIQVEARPPTEYGDEKGHLSRDKQTRESQFLQYAWDVKYGKYYNPDGTLMMRAGEVDKSLNQKVKETM